MRLCTIREAVMGSAEYKLPENVQQIMADFYLLQLLDHGRRRHESHRSDLIDREIEHVSSVLLPGIKKHMLSYVGYSLAREMRHLFDTCRLSSLPVRDPIYVSCVPEKYEFITQFISKKLASTMVSTIVKDLSLSTHDETDDDMLEVAIDATRLSNGMGHIPRSDTDAEVENIARAALHVFDPDVTEWTEGYGGQAWKDAATLWFKLAKAKSGSEITNAVDRIYQQQHNSGALLNKSPEYEGYWLDMMLNLKYKANDPEQMIPMASAYMRKLATAVLRDKHGRSYERGQENIDIVRSMTRRVENAIKSDEELRDLTNGIHTDEHGTLVFGFKSIYGNRYHGRIYPKAQGRDSGQAINYYNLILSPFVAGMSRISKDLMSPEDIVTALKLAY